MFSNCKSLLSISLNDEKDNKNLSLFLEKCDDNIFVYEEKENIIDSLINNSIVQNRDFNYTINEKSYSFTDKSEIQKLELETQKKRNNLTILNMFDIIDTIKINQEDYTILKAIFKNCESLSYIDINIFNNSNLTHVFNISEIFLGCSSLKSLPDISKFILKNSIDISSAFSGCSSLEKLLDISKWDIENSLDMSFLFSGCSSILSIPDISKWNTKNSSDMRFAFSGCKSLNLLNLCRIYPIGILIIF